MTQRAFNPRQLAMFMPVQQVIDTVHKIDNPDAIDAGMTPRQQWEDPLPETSMYAGSSLREAKLGAAYAAKEEVATRPPGFKGANHGYDIEQGVREHNVPPLRIQHFEHGSSDDSRRLALPKERQELWDGHHRLAMLEHLGHTEVPVWHSFDEDDDTPDQWIGVPSKKWG